VEKEIRAEEKVDHFATLGAVTTDKTFG